MRTTKGVRCARLRRVHRTPLENQRSFKRVWLTIEIMNGWSFFVRHVISVAAAILIVILCSLILVLLRPYLSTSVVALLYLVPVVISAAFWGRLAGISASILSFLIFLFFFVPPFYTFRVAHPQDFLAMIVLLSVAVLISSLMARVQANLEQVQAREHEAIQLYKLSTQLSGKNDTASIAKTLAQGLTEIFGSAKIEIEVTHPDQKVTIRVPEEELPGPPVTEIPLSTPRGQIGCIRIWNISERSPFEEERLLQTFVSQGALALDRTILADSETRAKVLEESDRLKTAILSSVSHELRTPLATIQTSATSLFNPAVELEPAARDELQSLLLEETDRMIHLVGNLLNMSRIEAGALKLQRQWNAFAEIVDTSVRRLSRVSGNHQIIVDVSEDLPLVSVDSVLMEQVLINLIRNSLRFAPPHTPILIHAKTDEQLILVTVSNAGPSIPDEYLDRVFEKFSPIPGMDTGQSTGLGLSICKGIVEAHGGKIWAANLRQGVAFTFSLPLSWEGARPVLPNEESEGE
jgi:two-component system, OmpR family, sensor histidine kinase KdpD